MDDDGIIVAPGIKEQQMKNYYSDLEKILRPTAIDGNSPTFAMI